MPVVYANGSDDKNKKEKPFTEKDLFITEKKKVIKKNKKKIKKKVKLKSTYSY
tara:strand:- start:7024 stop:7182 length:159 start_codon:yes stop_codon:yes gene_type:complete